MFERFKRLFRRTEVKASPASPPEPLSPVSVSDDLETAQFQLRMSGKPELPVHVSVEALASLAEVQVRTADEAEALVRGHMDKLERAALKALARGDVDGVICSRLGI